MKVQQRELKQVNAEYNRLVGSKEHEVKEKGGFVHKAKKELDHRVLRYE